MAMFERTDNQLVNFVLFLVDVFLGLWWVWVPWLVYWLISEGRQKHSSGNSGGSSYRHDGAGGDGGSCGDGFGGGGGGCGGDGGG
ncbi:hypothetical protein [Streptomyces sp. NPDC048612]|uniref:hypothetical protein n=1 Tax=Streptomyces sp. NPDC048612 TaxID=3365579 RepID=UPI0037214E80